MDRWSSDTRSILFLVHVEEIFRQYMSKKFLSSITSVLEEDGFDEIVLLDSQKGDGGILKEVRRSHSRYTIQAWAWGYAPKQIPSEETKWVIPARGHKWTYIPVFIRQRQFELQSMSVVIGGGADGECLTDWEDILLYLHIPYMLAKHLVY